MRVSSIQMNMKLGDVDYNFSHAEELVRRAVSEKEKPDVLLLPEAWNTGFFPKESIADPATRTARTKEVFGALAKELNVNIVAGSVSDGRAGKVYNTSYVFDRRGGASPTTTRSICSPIWERRSSTPGESGCAVSPWTACPAG